MLGSVSEDDMRSIVAAVVTKAKAGDLAAARVVFDYLVGKPQVTVDPDRVDIDGETLAHEKERRARAKYEAALGFRTAV
jgi:ribosomal protein L17